MAKPAVVQQISEHTPRGLRHRFRFFFSDHFFPDIYLSGKAIVVSDHILQRFSARVPDNVADDLVLFLLLLYGSPTVSMPVGHGRALVMPCIRSLVAFTYDETDTEYILTTCLTVDQIHSLVLEKPVQPVNFHYGPQFTRPRIRNCSPARWAEDVHERWVRKEPVPPPQERPRRLSDWHRVAQAIKAAVIKRGHGPASRIYFHDNIVGPNFMEGKPGRTEARYDDLDACTNACPQTLPPPPN